MVKSRLAAGLLLLAHGGEAAALEPVSADDAMKRYREVFQAPRAGCPAGGGGGADDITVCARRVGPDPNRLPLPVQPVRGARVEDGAPDQLAALEAGEQACAPIGPHVQCTGVIPLLPMALWLVQTAVKVTKGRD